MKNLLNVLIIDDDMISNYITGRIVKQLKIAKRLEFAKNGYEGLQTILKKCASSFLLAPHLILLDNNMPVMDGMEFLQAFGKLNFVNKEKVIIALMSSHISVLETENYRKLGVKEFLPKPINQEMISNICGKYEMALTNFSLLRVDRDSQV